MQSFTCLLTSLGEAGPRPYQSAGTVLCHCERVTAEEIDAAVRAVVPARDIDGLRRRTCAVAGRCQGFYCHAEVCAGAAASGADDGRLDGAAVSAADVVIVGGGPAGLSAAIELRRRGAGRVVVYERGYTPAARHEHRAPWVRDARPPPCHHRAAGTRPLDAKG